VLKPVIGINCDFEEAGEGRRHYPYLYLAYQDFVEAGGGIPLLLPPLGRPADAEALLDRIDGLLFTGSDDIDPACYGQPKHARCGRLIPSRKTDSDLALFRAARARRKPIFGICGGMQLVNVALGGTLIQDIPSQKPGGVVHKGERGAAALPEHPISIEPGTQLAEEIGEPSCIVNTGHHQAIDRPGEGLRASARAPDGIVEAIEGEGPFLTAVQWHPEKIPNRAGGRRLMKRFVDACRR
jgi:putative glutamine amidotransferase